MKKLLFALLAISGAAGNVSAEEAYIYPAGEMKVGQVVQLQFPTVLYVNKKCGLPLADAAHMRLYKSYRGVWDVGCWARTIDGDAVIVVPKMPTKTVPLDALVRADVQQDGTATIKALPSYGR
ncbi:hypothetical protein D3C72_1806290 [compost metagenome]